MQEIRRRTCVVDPLYDGKQALMPEAARLRHVAGTQWGSMCYQIMDSLQDLDLAEGYVA
jgi:hypothetical protein